MEINHNQVILLRNPINIEMNKERVSLNYSVVIALLRKFWLYLNGLICLGVHGMVIILIILVFVMLQISVFQGGTLCCFSSGALPGNVQSALAIYENLGTVKLKRCGEDSLLGRKIPRMLIVDSYCL